MCDKALIELRTRELVFVFAQISSKTQISRGDCWEIPQRSINLSATETITSSA